MIFDCDVLVVGAGPAGSIAALQLARAGVRVRILDRATFPRDKLCGDTLNPACLTLVSQIEPTVAACVRTRALKTTGMTVTGPHGVCVSADYPADVVGAALVRRDFDHWLLTAAIRAGARFEPSTIVQGPVLTDNADRVVGIRCRCRDHSRILRARVVIAADGRASRLGRALGLSRFARAPRRWAYGTYFTGIAGLTGRGEMHLRSDGYVGIAPLPGGIANVCVVRERKDLLACQSPAQVVATAIALDSTLQERFVSAERVSDVAVLGPLAVDSDACGAPGLLLAGDAAGFVDPMTGDGMRFAIRGGDLAAQAAIAELESGSPMHLQLRIRRIREFSAKCRFNRVLRGIVGSPHALTVAEIGARMWSLPVKQLIWVAGDVRFARRHSRVRIR